MQAPSRVGRIGQQSQVQLSCLGEASAYGYARSWLVSTQPLFRTIRIPRRGGLPARPRPNAEIALEGPESAAFAMRAAAMLGLCYSENTLAVSRTPSGFAAGVEGRRAICRPSGA